MDDYRNGNKTPENYVSISSELSDSGVTSELVVKLSTQNTSRFAHGGEMTKVK